MKFLLSLLLTAVFSFLLQLFLPWWSMIIAAFSVALIFNTGALSAFFSGFLGIALVWWGYAWMLDAQSQSILSVKIAELFQVGSPILLILLSGLLAGLVGGFAGWSGTTFRKMF